MYRLNHNAEPIPVLIIAKILRQICYALQYLQEMKIMHRDVQPENIYLTRNGTIKLAHFGQAKILLEIDSENICKTPVGKETYMSFEKLHNLHNASSIDVCQSYSFPSDIWSLGVLVLSMVSYFPEEPFHKLPKDFALIMHNENMPFQWLTVNMVQLRARLNRSGGELLKSFLSRKLLTVNIEDRETASSLPKTPEMRKWCLANVEEDKLFLRKKFIDDLDFANQCKIDTCVPNYDHLETKDIPPKFYWDDTWKELETREFSIKLQPSSFKASDLLLEQNFTLSNIRPLFIVLNSFIHHGIIELVDIIPLDFHIRELCYELVEKEKMHIKKNSSNKTFTL
uniref:mitogen-activated protein kinase kinase n=1 Tax=Acrobeloides nanus TaxID=290746 RepID=A0A914CXQ0_9BILA